MAKRHVSVPPVDLSWTPDVEVVLTWHNFTSEVVGSREGQLRTESRRELGRTCVRVHMCVGAQACGLAVGALRAKALGRGEGTGSELSAPPSNLSASSASRRGGKGSPRVMRE